MITDDVVTSGGVPQPAHSSRWQLAVIGAVIVLAVGIGTVLGFTMLGPRTNALGSATSYLPPDTVIYAEMRLDLSPAQSGSLRAILERFPAADADIVLLDAIGSAIDEGLTASDSPITYAADVAPWFDGRVGLGLLDYPLAAMTTGEVTIPRMAALFGVKDPAAAQAFADKLRREAETTGAAFTSTQHAGVTIWTLHAGNAPAGGTEAAFAVTADQFVVASDSVTVESLLDVHGGTESLATRAEMPELAARLPSDWVGFFAVDSRQIADQMRDAIAAGDASVAALMDPYLDSIPPMALSTFSLQDDAFVYEAAALLPGGDLAPQNGRRNLAARVPSDALFFADGGKVGSGLSQLITGMRGGIAMQPGGEEVKRMLEQAEAALGADLEDFVSWIDSGALAVGWSGDAPYGGLLLEAGDVDAATARIGQLRALLDMVAGPSTQIRVTTDTVAGVEVTTIDFSSAIGADDAAPNMPDAKLQYAISDGTVLIGLGSDFVGRSLGLSDGDSLADVARFTGAVDRFGSEDNAGVTFLDLAGLRETVERVAGPELPAEYATKIRPNLEALDYIVGVTRVDGDAVVSRGGLVLR